MKSRRVYVETVYVYVFGGFPLPIPPPTTLGPQTPRVLFPRSRPLGVDPPPRSWERGGETYDWRAAAPNLFVFVLTATCTMRRQNLTPGRAH